MADALAELRRREVAGEPVRTLEEWLHRHGPRPDVDVGTLLTSYKFTPAIPQPSKDNA